MKNRKVMFLAALSLLLFSAPAFACDGPYCSVAEVTIGQGQLFEGGSFVIPTGGITFNGGEQGSEITGSAIGFGASGAGTLVQEQKKISGGTASLDWVETSQTALVGQSTELNLTVNGAFANIEAKQQAGNAVMSNSKFTGVSVKAGNFSSSELGGGVLGNGSASGQTEGQVINEFGSVAYNPTGYNAVSGVEGITTEVSGGAGGCFGAFEGKAFGANSAEAITFSSVSPKGEMVQASASKASTIGCVEAGSIGNAGVNANVNAGQTLSTQQYAATPGAQQYSASTITTSVVANGGNIGVAHQGSAP